MKKNNITSDCIKSCFFGIKKYFYYLVKNNALDKNDFYNIFDDIDLPRVVFRKQEVYLKDDVKKIINIFKNLSHTFTGLGNLIFLLISATTGARHREIALLKISDIDFNTEHITFYHTKNRRPRSIKIKEDLIQLLKKYFDVIECHTMSP